MDWYALNVRTRGELQVNHALVRKQYETFCPTYKEARQYKDRVKKIDSALFPGYLFIKLEYQHHLPVLQTPGVHHLIPTPVDATELTAIDKVLQTGTPAVPWPFLKTGNKVQIEYGAFTGQQGILVSEKGKDRLVLSITLLQRSIAIEVDRLWIRPL